MDVLPVATLNRRNDTAEYVLQVAQVRGNGARKIIPRLVVGDFFQAELSKLFFG